MTIFFTASIRGYKKFKSNYDTIYKIIKSFGHSYVGNYPFTVTPEEVYSYNQNENMDLFNSMNKFMKNCDLMILEVSQHSVSMGYMIMKMISLRKPVIALYTKNNRPAFLEGIEYEKFQLIEYNFENLKEMLKQAIEDSKNSNSSRFNLMLNSEQLNYIEEQSELNNTSKAAYIRSLIINNMNKNTNK